MSIKDTKALLDKIFNMRFGENGRLGNIFQLLNNEVEELTNYRKSGLERLLEYGCYRPREVFSNFICALNVLCEIDGEITTLPASARYQLGTFETTMAALEKSCQFRARARYKEIEKNIDTDNPWLLSRETYFDNEPETGAYFYEHISLLDDIENYRKLMSEYCSLASIEIIDRRASYTLNF